MGMADEKPMVPKSNAPQQMRVNVPGELWELLEEVAIVMEASPKWCFGMLLKRIEHLSSTSQVDVLGYEFAQARQRLNSRGKFGASAAARTIDLMKLHRSDKLKSGLVGVYANGQGFRAVGRNPTSNTLMHLGTFPSADEAAWTRYLHYQKHNLPYGEYAERLEQLTKAYGPSNYRPDQIKKILDDEIAEEQRSGGLPPQVF
jgi:hypothetical protein